MLLNAVILAQIGIGWLFIRYLIQQDHGPKEPSRALLVAGIFGALAVPIAIAFETLYVPDGLIANEAGLNTEQLMHASLLIGVIEEAAKVLPLAIFLYAKRYFNEMTDGVIYFAIAGMVFGVLENISYSLSYGAGVGITRIIVAPYIHAAFCALFGWMLAWRKVHSVSWGAVALGAAASIGVHAAYDFGLFYQKWWSVLGALAMAVALNVGVFLLLRLAQRMDARSGLASDGLNLYCRSCGTPNPERYMYCTHCGQRT